MTGPILLFLLVVGMPAGAQTESKTLRVGVPHRPPLAYADTTGRPAGLLVDLFEFVASGAGWQTVFIPGTVESCAAELEAGRLDLVIGLARSEVSWEEAIFSTVPVFTNWGTVYVRKGLSVDSLLDLRSMRVALVADNPQTRAFRELASSFDLNIETVGAPDTVAMFRMLAGEAEAGVTDRVSGLRYEHDYRVERTGIVFNALDLVYVSRQGAGEGVLRKLDTQIASLRSSPGSMYYILMDRYFPQAATARAMPEGIKWSLLPAAALIVMLFLFNLVLKRQVAGKTDELERELGERRKAQERLQQNEDDLRSTLNSIGDGVIVTDRAGRVRRMNPVAELLTGASLEDSRGKALRDVFRAAHSATGEPVDSIPELIAGGDALTGVADEVSMTGAGDVVKRVSRTVTPLRGEDGAVRGAVVAFRDVTDRHRMEEQLRQSQKMEAIGRLAGGVAHDFNNMLQTVLGYGELIKAKLAGDPEGIRDVERIIGAGEQAMLVVDQLLTFSRRRSVHRESVDLNRLLGDLNRLLRPVLGDLIEIGTQFGEGLDSVTADPVQLRQAILNLSLNARDAMVEGGRLRFETANRTLDSDADGGPPDLPAGRYVVVTVRDSGPGIPTEIMPRVFEPFFTTRQREGAGLGLATVYAIVTAHGGAVHCDSELGRGTAMSIWLPASAPTVARGPADRIPGWNGVGGDETVLLAEDEENLRRLACRVLGSSGYHVLAAADGNEATDLFDRHGDEISLLILDVMMPGKSGRAVYEHAVRKRPGIPVIFTSGYTQDQLESEYLLRIPGSLLRKPYRPQDFLKAVRDMLDRRKVG